MSATVTFVFNDEEYSLENVPVPPVGSQIELNGRHYSVNSVALSYWTTELNNNSLALVHLDSVADRPS
jgi:hypothetical protein